MMENHLCLIIFFLCPSPAVHGYIWAWMYSLPNQDPSEVAAIGSGPSASRDLKAAVCSQEVPCPQGLFCDHHFGLCLSRREEGEYCRWDTHCAKGLNCMFGRCHLIVPSGQEGARCHQDKDCGPHACCARLHGEMVCKKRLHLGDGCYIPQGGIAFSLNQVCPCLEGLVCRRTSSKQQIAAEYRPEKGEWQCQKK
ncbi:dickkopf-related protein 3-like [Heteronotia binoei]|uniref:dickkopf-related protein 3-like n=1 Tax=Heteronotia binoei TaxID=13085 RepID=UPI00292F81AF|nr:dickkopf-related protein 3-like [Heteronotia binoei]